MNLVVVGKFKDKNLEQLENNYLKRIASPKLALYEVKAKAENKESEGLEVLKKISSIAPNPYIVLLTEFGESFHSPEFSHWLFDRLEKNKDIFFVISGAEGPSDKLKRESQFQLSLGKMTMPHKLARIILVEQIYRAQTIHNRHPYHN